MLYKKFFKVIFSVFLFLNCLVLVNAESINKKNVYIRLDYQEVLGVSGHTTPSTVNGAPSSFNWLNFPVEITDTLGNVYPLSDKDVINQRLVGKFPVGEVLTVKVDTKGIPEGYHMSKISGYDYSGFSGFNSFKYTVKEGDNTIFLSFGQTDLVFDLMGGNVSGNIDRIIKRIGASNQVDFPVPVKENLKLRGWYTENNTIGSGGANRAAGKIYHSTVGMYSDYSHDWKSYNDDAFDKKYDGKFVLRAQWVADVVFETEGGSVINNKVVEEGAVLTKPDDPIKNGFTFGYWDNGGEYDFSVPVMKNLTLTAVWIENPIIDVVREGDKKIFVKEPLNVDKIVITVSNDKEIVIIRNNDSKWIISNNGEIKVNNGKLEIPMNDIVLKEKDKIVIVNHNGTRNTNPVEFSVISKLFNSGTINSDYYSDTNKLILPATGTR